MLRQVAPRPRRGIRRWPALRRLRRRLFALAVWALLGLVARAPRAVVTPCLDALARLAWRTRRHEREVARRQLALAFPQWKRLERDALGRESLRVMAANLVDAIRGDRGVWFEAADLAQLEELRGTGRPLLLLCAHLGAWELLGAALATRLPGFAVVSAEPHNRSVGRQLARARARRGVRSFDRQRDAVAAARWLRRGGALAILADHRSGVSSLQADWFGAPAPTVRAPARWARRFDAVVQAVGIRRDPAGHRVLLGAQLCIGPAEAEFEFARRCNAALEELIRRSPVEWTWIHARYAHWPKETAP